MQIVYDGHIFRWQKIGGVSRYFSEVISRLPSDCTPTIVGACTGAENFPTHPKLRVSPLCSIRPRRFSQPLKTSFWRSNYLDSKAIFHPTYYRLSGGLRFSDLKCPIVVTVHDLIKARFPHLEGDSNTALREQKEAISAADHLICVSRSTERDLLEFYPEVEGRTSVVYHGSSFPVRIPSDTDSLFETPTFLFVGRRATYKNFQMLLRAFANAVSSDKRIRLCLAGPPLNDDERWQIHFLGITDQVHVVENPDESALENLYRQSLALLYPSRYEGFGIPVLEAMACGTLPIAANTSSIPEVIGDGGIMLDPANETEWTECILAVASRKTDRKSLLQKAASRAALFSWQTSAKRHVEIYKTLE
jgi:glycosyltransferase involved in cell wall biosynthesis